MAVTANGLHVVVVAVGAHRLGFPSGDVAEVLAAPEITPLPGAPAPVEGVIDLRGTIVPVLGLRRRLGLPERGLVPGDRLLVVERAGRPLALRADAALDLVGVPPGALQAGPAEGARHAAGVVALEDGLLVVCDLEAFLSEDEEAALAAALAAAGGTG